MSDGGWFDYGPGVRVRRLGGEGGAGFYLMRMEAGAVQARHAHPQRETVLVLEGEVELSRGVAMSLSLLVPGCSRTVPSSMEHEIRAVYDTLLLAVARPDFPAP